MTTTDEARALPDLTPEAVERLAADLDLARKVMFDMGTFETGQAICTDAAATLRALSARLADAESRAQPAPVTPPDVDMLDWLESLAPSEPSDALRKAYAEYKRRVIKPASTYTAANLEAAVKRALEGHAATVRNIWAQCEQVEDACHEHLSAGTALTEHEQGFWRGQKMLAKSIRRSTEMPQADPATVARIARGET